jgi:hypothetical protein
MKRLKDAVKFGWPVALGVIAVQAVLFGNTGWPHIVSGIFTGLLGGLFFNAGMSYFKKFAHGLAEGITIDLAHDERVLLEAPANHLLKHEGVGGKLWLTDKRLVFKSHKLNFQNHEQSFALHELSAIKKEEKLKLGFRLELLNKDVHKFIVDSPSEWISTLESRRVAS